MGYWKAYFFVKTPWVCHTDEINDQKNGYFFLGGVCSGAINKFCMYALYVP